MRFILREAVTRAQSEGMDGRSDVDVLVGCTFESQLVESELFESIVSGVEERVERIVGCFAVAERDVVF